MNHSNRAGFTSAVLAFVLVAACGDDGSESAGATGAGGSTPLPTSSTGAPTVPATAVASSSSGGDGGGGGASTAAQGGGGEGTGGTCLCASPDDCAPPDDVECMNVDCLDCACQLTFVADGEPTATQEGGDCVLEVCDGRGGRRDEPDDGDLPDDDNDCTDDACDDGTPAYAPRDEGDACEGGLCDGDGACVAECDDEGDCGPDTACTTFACDAGVCVPTYTEVGTGIEDPTPGDCRRSVCAAQGEMDDEVIDDDDPPAPPFAGACLIYVCTDGEAALENAPLDTPCTFGGGSFCDVNAQCVECTNDDQCGASGTCYEPTATCYPETCFDGVVSGQEGGLDCGGPDCFRCGEGADCTIDSDCDTTFCNPTTDVCAFPSCSDGFANGAESDVDCGGSCTKCSPGDDCNLDTDCNTGFCHPETDLCTIATCGDGYVQNAESCDDGAQDVGDGCSDACATEPGYACDGDDCDVVAGCTTATCFLGSCAPGDVVASAFRGGLQVPVNGDIGIDLTIAQTGTVRRVVAGFEAGDPQVNRLGASISSPDQTVRAILANNGGQGMNFTGTFFRDGVPRAATSLSAADAPYTGVFRPVQAFRGEGSTGISSLSGGPSQGTWRFGFSRVGGPVKPGITSVSIALCVTP